MLAPRQGPITRPAGTVGWLPLSEVTLESLKPTHGSPWSKVDLPLTDTSRSGSAAPCQVACPAGTDAGRYVGAIAAGRYDEAYAVAAEVNPFPSVCGWICTAPCEAACRRGSSTSRSRSGR